MGYLCVTHKKPVIRLIFFTNSYIILQFMFLYSKKLNYGASTKLGTTCIIAPFVSLKKGHFKDKSFFNEKVSLSQDKSHWVKNLFSDKLNHTVIII